MKITATVICPYCHSYDGFDLEVEDVNTKVIKAVCSNCGKVAFKTYAFSLYEVDEKGNLVNDQDLKTFD